MNNINKFCRFVNNEIGYFAEKIIQDISLAKVYELQDSFWWPYFNSFNAVRKKLKELKLWNIEGE